MRVARKERAVINLTYIISFPKCLQQPGLGKPEFRSPFWSPKWMVESSYLNDFPLLPRCTREKLRGGNTQYPTLRQRICMSQEAAELAASQHPPPNLHFPAWFMKSSITQSQFSFLSFIRSLVLLYCPVS